METMALRDLKMLSQIGLLSFVIFDAILVHNSFHKPY